MKVTITRRIDIQFLTHELGKKQNVSHTWMLVRQEQALPPAAGARISGKQLSCPFVCPHHTTNANTVLAHWEHRLFNRSLLLVLTDAVDGREAAKPGGWRGSTHGLPGLHEPLRQEHVSSVSTSAHSSLGRVWSHMFRIDHLNTCQKSNNQKAGWKSLNLSSVLMRTSDWHAIKVATSIQISPLSCKNHTDQQKGQRKHTWPTSSAWGGDWKSLKPSDPWARKDKVGENWMASKG